MKALRNMLLPVLAMSLGLGLIACTEDRHSAIPASAQMVARTNNQGAWSAPRDGKVWIDDGTGNKLLWAGEIKHGQSVALDEAKNKVMLDGRVVSDREIPGGTYRIWFEPAKEMTLEHTTIERTHETKVREDRD